MSRDTSAISAGNPAVESHALTCGSDQTLLDCCIQAGIPAPYNCRSGECGECKAKLLSGEVYEMPGADPAIFNDTHRNAGELLLCMCFPRSPVVVDVPLKAEETAIRPTTINTMVELVERVTPSILQVCVETPGPVTYRAGQCFEWVLPGIKPNRIYSAANRPGSDRIEFHVRIYPGGKVGEFVTEHLAPGQSLELVGPFGQFGLSASDWRPAICIAGGTGLAPVQAILDQAFAHGDGRPIQFFYGARCETSSIAWICWTNGPARIRRSPLRRSCPMSPKARVGAGGVVSLPTSLRRTFAMRSVSGPMSADRRR